MPAASWIVQSPKLLYYNQQSSIVKLLNQPMYSMGKRRLVAVHKKRQKRMSTTQQIFFWKIYPMNMAYNTRHKYDPRAHTIVRQQDECQLYHLPIKIVLKMKKIFENKFLSVALKTLSKKMRFEVLPNFTTFKIQQNKIHVRCTWTIVFLLSDGLCYYKRTLKPQSQDVVDVQTVVYCHITFTHRMKFRVNGDWDCHRLTARIDSLWPVNGATRRTYVVIICKNPSPFITWSWLLHISQGGYFKNKIYDLSRFLINLIFSFSIALFDIY